MSSPFLFLLAQKRSLGKMLCLLKGFSINEEETPWKFSQLGWYSWDITLLTCRWDNKDVIREFSQWGDKHCSNKTLNKTLKSMDKCKRKRCVKLAVIWQWYNTQHTLKNNIKKLKTQSKLEISDVRLFALCSTHSSGWFMVPLHSIPGATAKTAQWGT